MSNIIDKIQLSGVTYDIGGQGGSGVSVVEVTQAEYDALPSSAKTDTSKMYVITDAEAGDLTNYYTKTETNTLLGGKQATLVSGTNIKTINNESLLGSGNIDIQGGGGKAVSGGTNISITTGTTADTINCTLPIREGSNSSGKGIIVGDSECTASGLYGISLGHSSDANGAYSFCNGSNSYARGQMSFAYGDGCDAVHAQTFMFGHSNVSTKSYQYSFGNKVKPKNELEFGFGTYNNSSSASTTFGHSGNTMFSIGNGYDFSSTHNWHNAFEVRQNGDIYIPNTNDTSVTGDYAYSLYPMIKLQDVLDSKQTTLTAGTGISIVDNVISATGGGGGGMTEDDELLLATALTDLNDRKIDASEVKSNYQRKGDYVTKTYVTTALEPYETKANVEQVEEVTAYALNDLNERFGGLKIVKITESEYAALTTKDENTLYIVVADPS